MMVTCGDAPQVTDRTEVDMGDSHDHGASLTGTRMLLSVFITVAFVIGEAAAGYFSNSLALLSDAGHNFAAPRQI
jgi:Co/Zn/Cd efflux system component